MDNKTIKAAAKGRNKAQRTFFEHYYPYIMSICLRYFRSYEESEEALNDSFLKIFNALHKFDCEQHILPWIRKITVNVCIDRIRKLSRDPVTIPIDSNTHNATDDKDFEIPDEKNILPLIQCLSPAYRAVFNLYVFEDLKHREIADLLNISEGTSKSNYARAKIIIKQKISNDKRKMKEILYTENGS